MIKEYLLQTNLVERVLTLDEILSKTKSKKSINIMMGQTYDDGQPIDLLKYSLFIMNFQDLLAQKGVGSNSTILLADHFMTEFNKEMDVEDARRLGELRKDFLQSLNMIYNGRINFLYSSDLSKTPEYYNTLDKLELEKERNIKFKSIMLQAVPEKRRDNSDALKYPFEEIACISALDTDIKIGPPYEIFYDKPARDSAEIIGLKSYSAIHLTKSQLYGKIPQLEEKDKANIQEYGILPYQIRSKKLMDNRIDLGNLGLDKINSLIDMTDDKESLIDLLVICELAEQRIEAKPQITFYANNTNNLLISTDISLSSLKDKTKEYFKRYIANLINEVNII